MLRNRILLFSTILCLSSLPISAETVTLKDLISPQAPAYRVGLTEIPEKQYIQAQEEKINSEQKYARLDSDKNKGFTDLTYADLSIKRLSKEISQTLEYEEQEMVSDLSLLWQGAAVQSDTINFALYKLANPDADKPNEKSIKNVLKTIASMSTLVGASMGNPLLAGSSLIGGNILGIMSQDTKALNYKYTKVNDADMIILIRKVEDLQQKAVDLYYDYMSAKKQLEFANELVADRQKKFELAQKNNAARELIVITDAYYRTSLDKQRLAKAEFFSKRAALEQFVGNETFLQFEQELAQRESGEAPKKENSNEEISDFQNKEYENTIKNVENYTKNINSANIEPQEELSENADFSVDNIDKISKTDNITTQNSTLNNQQGYNPYMYDYYATPTTELNNVNLPEEGGGFYSDFATGFAASTLAEFLTPDDGKVKQKQPKIKKSKAKKEKISDKTNKTKDKEQKIQKSKIKKQKVKKEKPVKQKTPRINNSEQKSNQNNQRIEWLYTKSQKDNTDISSEETKTKKEKTKKVKSKKVKTDKDKLKSDNAEKNVKEKKQKKVRDPYPELHGQKPLHKYPRNSTKDLIFLHGQDKHSIKKSVQGNTKNEVKEAVVQTTSPASANVTVNDFIPLDSKPISNPTAQNTNIYGLLPLDEIKVPELTKGGYSIHSDLGY